MAPRPLTEHQFNTLAVLAQNPKEYRLAWHGAGAASFGCGADPTDREGCRDLIISVPVRYRWPCTNTVKSLRRRGYIQEVKDAEFYFYRIFEITPAGLMAHKADSAYDAGPHGARKAEWPA